jgi:hypothetical protein
MDLYEDIGLPRGPLLLPPPERHIILASGSRGSNRLSGLAVSAPFFGPIRRFGVSEEAGPRRRAIVRARIARRKPGNK